jgi:hypothetical protein
MYADGNIHAQRVDEILIRVKDSIIDDLATGIEGCQGYLAAVVRDGLGIERGIRVIVKAVATDARRIATRIRRTLGVHDAVAVAVADGRLAVPLNAEVRTGGTEVDRDLVNVWKRS